MTKQIEELEDKITALEFKLDDMGEFNEEIQIDLNIIIAEMLEENDRVSKHDDSPYDLGQWNIHQLQKIKELVKKIKV